MFLTFVWTYIDKNDWYGQWGGTDQRPYKMPTLDWSVEMSGPMSYFTARSRRMSGSWSSRSVTTAYAFEHGRSKAVSPFRPKASVRAKEELLRRLGS